MPSPRLGVTRSSRQTWWPWELCPDALGPCRLLRGALFAGGVAPAEGGRWPQDGLAGSHTRSACRGMERGASGPGAPGSSPSSASYAALSTVWHRGPSDSLHSESTPGRAVLGPRTSGVESRTGRRGVTLPATAGGQPAPCTAPGSVSSLLLVQGEQPAQDPLAPQVEVVCIWVPHGPLFGL